MSELMTLVNGIPDGRPDLVINTMSFKWPLAGEDSNSTADVVTGVASDSLSRIPSEAAVTAGCCVESHLL